MYLGILVLDREAGNAEGEKGSAKKGKGGVERTKG
jgi:hypothetical protein